MSNVAQLKNLTGLRGVAALWVLGFHLLGVFDLWGWNLGLLRAPLEAGYLGVDLFFVLSGFVIAHAYATKLSRKTPWLAWRSFMHRRLARMYPVHLFVILVIIAGIVGSRAIGRDFAEGGDYELANLVRHLTLSQVWLPGGTPSWNGPSWSIHAEWFAYACFPFFAALLLRCSSIAKLITVGAGGYLVLIGVVEFGLGGDYDRSYDFGILRCVIGFAAGTCLWRSWQLGSMKPQAVAKLARWWPAVVLALLLLGTSPAVLLPALALVVPCLASKRHRLLLASRPLQYLGRISYALYMTHHVVLTQLGARLPGNSSQSWIESLALFGGYLLIIGLVAHLVHSLVEEPMRNVMLLNSHKPRLVNQIAKRYAGS